MSDNPENLSLLICYALAFGGQHTVLKADGSLLDFNQTGSLPKYRDSSRLLFSMFVVFVYLISVAAKRPLSRAINVPGGAFRMM
jgi:hypothetical protein